MTFSGITDPASATIRIVIIIPTYNNDRTITQVVQQAREKLDRIIVVNDGSTDTTSAVLAVLQGVTVVTLAVNGGKGTALQAGFARALELGFTHAITMDGDGQHLAQDIPILISKIHEAPEAIWVGSRILPSGGVPQPARSKFGKEFGSFWYLFNTGIRLTDTQSGFRVYPLTTTVSLGCRSAKYEYELELLILAAWKGIAVKEIPIHILYLPQEERVSHFRPIRDFLRVGKINARSATIRIIMPWRFISAPGKNLKEKLYHLVMKEIKGDYGPRKSALSLAIGVLFGLLPIYGLQVAGVVAVSIALRLSKLLALLGVSISSAPFLPFWIAAGLGIGKIAVPSTLLISTASFFGSNPTTTSVLINLAQWAVGSTILAVSLALATYAVSYPLFLRYSRIRNMKNASVQNTTTP